MVKGEDIYRSWRRGGEHRFADQRAFATGEVLESETVCSLAGTSGVDNAGAKA